MFQREFLMEVREWCKQEPLILGKTSGQLRTGRALFAVNRINIDGVAVTVYNSAKASENLSEQPRRLHESSCYSAKYGAVEVSSRNWGDPFLLDIRKLKEEEPDGGQNHVDARYFGNDEWPLCFPVQILGSPVLSLYVPYYKEGGFSGGLELNSADVAEIRRHLINPLTSFVNTFFVAQIYKIARDAFAQHARNSDESKLGREFVKELGRMLLAKSVTFSEYPADNIFWSEELVKKFADGVKLRIKTGAASFAEIELPCYRFTDKDGNERQSFGVDHLKKLSTAVVAGIAADNLTYLRERSAYQAQLQGRKAMLMEIGGGLREVRIQLERASSEASALELRATGARTLSAIVGDEARLSDLFREGLWLDRAGKIKFEYDDGCSPTIHDPLVLSPKDDKESVRKIGLRLKSHDVPGSRSGSSNVLESIGSLLSDCHELQTPAMQRRARGGLLLTKSLALGCRNDPGAVVSLAQLVAAVSLSVFPRSYRYEFTEGGRSMACRLRDFSAANSEGVVHAAELMAHFAERVPDLLYGCELPKIPLGVTLAGRTGVPEFLSAIIGVCGQLVVPTDHDWARWLEMKIQDDNVRISVMLSGSLGFEAYRIDERTRHRSLRGPLMVLLECANQRGLLQPLPNSRSGSDEALPVDVHRRGIWVNRTDRGDLLTFSFSLLIEKPSPGSVERPNVAPPVISASTPSEAAATELKAIDHSRLDALGVASIGKRRHYFFYGPEVNNDDRTESSHRYRFFKNFMPELEQVQGVGTPRSLCEWLGAKVAPEARGTVLWLHYRAFQGLRDADLIATGVKDRVARIVFFTGNHRKPETPTVSGVEVYCLHALVSRQLDDSEVRELAR